MDKHTPELLPCPFCGCSVTLEKPVIPDTVSRWIKHPKNGCIMTKSNFSVDQWNTRSLTSQLATVTAERDKAQSAEIRNADIALAESRERQKVENQLTEERAKVERLREAISARDGYINLLIEELNSAVPMAVIHGWSSRNVERGNAARNKIKEADEALAATAPTEPESDDD